MLVLIDYDNIEEIDRQRGISYFAEKVLRLLSTEAIANVDRVKIRLYGGWFQEKRMTRRAQLLAAKIGADFPRHVTILHGDSSRILIADCQLALSLECTPSEALTHTFRERGANLVQSLQCTHPPFLGCINVGDCHLSSLSQYVSSRGCPRASCPVKLENVLGRAEQKLVDAMLVTDLLHSTVSGEQQLVVVSSDDDVWPGIRAALAHGASVLHVHTRSDRQTRSDYTKYVKEKYSVYHLGQ